MLSQSILNRLGLGAAVTFAGTSAMAADESPGAKPQRPNIVLMLADDMGYGNVGCNGATEMLTPNIDSIASQGLRFTDAHSPAAVCQPTRYAILSGRGYWRCRWGRYQAGTYFRSNEVVFPKLLQESGYSTAMFGKWHLGFGGFLNRGDKGDINGKLSHGPNWAGFDYFFGMVGSHAQPPYVWIENEGVYKRDPNDPIQIISHEEAKKRGIQLPANLPNWGWSVGGKAAHEALKLDRVDLEIAERAGRWISQQKKDKPFFLYMALFAPHVPLAVAEEFRNKSPLYKKVGRQTNATLTADYCQQLDYAVGMILEALKKNGFDDNTLVVFSSDNGNLNLGDNQSVGFRTNGPFNGGKSDTWEGGHHIPMIARWKNRIPAGKVTDKLFSQIDLYDTFLAAARVNPPKVGGGEDSLNQLALFENPETCPPIRKAMEYKGKAMGFRIGDWVYLPHQGRGGLDEGGPCHKLGFTNSDYDESNKLKPDAPPGQLYNIRKDISQSANLYKEHPDLVEQFKKVQEASAKKHKNVFDESYIPYPISDFLRVIDDKYVEQLWPKEFWRGEKK